MTFDEWADQHRFDRLERHVAQLAWEAARQYVTLKGTAILAFKDRAIGLEGYVSDRAQKEQKHLEIGTVEREYWHYGYMMALRDVVKRLDGTDASKEK